VSKLPVLTSIEAERLLLRSGFVLLRVRGSHRIYIKDYQRIIIPFHVGKALHPKIVKQVLKAIEL
jgi:predicted RNA binding protein YcfA (HicA-like mRNA interferase family)